MLKKLRFFILVLCSFFSFLSADYKVAVCAIFKNDARFLKEWIEFHKLQGVEHFYLYNNNSEDKYQEILNPYIEKGEVTLTQWLFTYDKGDRKEWLKIQRSAYRDCLTLFGHECQWMAFIDTDEFLFCPQGEQLDVFLSDYTEFGGVVVNWLMFGTSNVKKIPNNKLMIELLVQCARSPHCRDHYVKSIVQPKYALRPSSPHNFTYIKSKFAVSEDKKEVKGIYSKNISLDRIRINHYWTRDEKYFKEFKLPSRQERRTFESTELLKARAKSYNEDTDTAILRYVPLLRLQMQQLTQAPHQ